jgi:uncharacterized protein (DUF433 family)
VSTIDLLDRVVYTMPQVDRLLSLAAGTSRRWIDGYERSGKVYRPIIRAESTNESLVTWGEFVETRLLAEYRDSGVRIFRLRRVVDELRRQLDVRYPLAYEQQFLAPEGKELIWRVQDEADLERRLRIVVTRNDQIQLADPAADFIQAAGFDGGKVVRITPDPQIPEVVVDPLRASGDPVVRAVPTEILAEQARAGDSPERLADLYDLPLDQVEAAIRFERHHAA